MTQADEVDADLAARRAQRWAAAERILDVQAARRIRRTPWILIGLTALLVLAVGVTAAVDLRRLQTPRGTALAWTQAAVFGDCRAYLVLSAPPDPAGDRRTDDELCGMLRASTAPARSQARQITLTAGPVERRGGTASVTVAVHRPEGTQRVALRLRRSGEGWVVLREPACVVLGCP